MDAFTLVSYNFETMHALVLWNPLPIANEQTNKQTKLSIHLIIAYTLGTHKSDGFILTR